MLTPKLFGCTKIRFGHVTFLTYTLREIRTIRSLKQSKIVCYRSNSVEERGTAILDDLWSLSVIHITAATDQNAVVSCWFPSQPLRVCNCRGDMAVAILILNQM